MNLLGEQKKFEKKYDAKVCDLLVLISDSGGGAMGVSKGIWQPSVDILAYIDMETGELKKGKGRISWLAEEKDQAGWIYNLEEEKIYHLKVRKIKNKKVPEHMLQWLSNSFMLVDVVERDLKQPELEQILEDYKRPVVMEDKSCGIFTLERKYNWFCSKIDWLGNECSVTLECDTEDGDTAVKAMEVFHIFYKDLEMWDEKFRSFAALRLGDIANDWLQDTYEEEDEEEQKMGEEEPREITEAEFADRIWIEAVTIYPGGDYEVYYHDDDIFWGHVIIVSGNIETGMEDAEIAG